MKDILPTLALLPIFGLQSLAASAQNQDKPNVVFIFADDMTFSALSDVSQDELYTPNLDKLKENGMAFSHVFNQGAWNGAVSMASRAMLCTGKYLWKAKNLTTSKDFKNKYNTEPTLWSQWMKNAGYNTYITGKWHVPANPSAVFDEVRHIRAGMPSQSPDGYRYTDNNPNGRKFIPGKEDRWHPADSSYGGYWKGGKHWSEVVKDDAIAFIDDASSKESPFFMYLAFNAVHDPRQAPQEFQDMYSLDDIRVPDSYLPVYPYYREVGCGEGLRDERLAPFPRTKYSVKVNRKEYYALLTHMDVQIGEIIKALKESGQYENTYIIFTADHGLAIGDHGFIGKQNMYDASMRVPMIISGPGVKRGNCDEMIYLQTAMATALDIAGSEAVGDVDFKSILPLAEGKRHCSASHKYIYGAYINLQRMIRSKKYKMIIYPRINVVRLYNLDEDPAEMYDLAGLSKYRKVMDSLFEQLQKEQKKVGDTLDLTNSYEAFFTK